MSRRPPPRSSLSPRLGQGEARLKHPHGQAHHSYADCNAPDVDRRRPSNGGGSFPRPQARRRVCERQPATTYKR